MLVRTPGVAALRPATKATPRPRAVSPQAAPARRLSLGAAPVLALVAAGGLVMVALGNNAAREETSGAEALFWGGLVVIYAPLAFRMLSASASRADIAAVVASVAQLSAPP